VKTREIIIPQDSLLERILKLQQPARTDRIREKMGKSPEGFEVIPRQKFFVNCQQQRKNYRAACPTQTAMSDALYDFIDIVGLFKS
jgi:hypothetical protein